MRTAHTPVFKLGAGDFEAFLPARATRCTDGDEIDSPMKAPGQAVRVRMPPEAESFLAFGFSTERRNSRYSLYFATCLVT